MPSIRRVIVVAVSVTLGLGVAGHFGLVGLSVYQEKDVSEVGRLYRAKSDIEGIEKAVRMFREKHGRYPTDLSELIGEPRGTSGKEGALLVAVLRSPWLAPYRYQAMEKPGGGFTYRIWVEPEKVAQQKFGLFELSNQTEWSKLKY